MRDRKKPAAWRLLMLVFAVAAMLPEVGEAQQRSSSDEGNRVLAVIDGRRVITQREVDEMIGHQLFVLQEKIYALRKGALDSLINRIIIEEEARARGDTLEEFTRRLVPGQIDVKQAQIEQLYAESAGRF
ncbi:MAG TPA: hypothetical protein VNO14_15565, partial [Blastocatellia bacterium]|nr:hypothetical protein [Blastocatellia bacterium]